MKKSRGNNKEYDDAKVAAKNLVKLRILISIKSFDSEVKMIRNEFSIPKNLNSIVEAWSWLSQSKYAIFEPYHNYPGSLDFRNRIDSLCERYYVQNNFYDCFFIGVPLYILSGIVIAPSSNWEIFHDWGKKDNERRWVDVRIYTPLTKSEIDEFMLYVNGDINQKVYAKGIFQNKVVKKEHKLFHRDMDMVESLTARQGKPLKVKKYKPGSYLTYASKDKSLNSKAMRKLEKLHPGGIETAFNEQTARQIAKNKRVKPDVARQAKTRINKMAKKLYGHTLDE